MEANRLLKRTSSEPTCQALTARDRCRRQVTWAVLDEREGADTVLLLCGPHCKE